MPRTIIPLIVMIPSLMLTACGDKPDPIDQPGTWSVHNDNDANLLSMLANPADLQRGAGSDESDTGRGGQSAAAIDRLLTDKTRPLGAAANFAVGGSDAGSH